MPPPTTAPFSFSSRHAAATYPIDATAGGRNFAINRRDLANRFFEIATLAILERDIARVPKGQIVTVPRTDNRNALKHGLRTAEAIKA